ncbi:MAG: hypothetical protein HY401_10015 [Elusimicrobia bacterium]|nr:hypothetical protein [Elusimicrobiota bacterium]
MAPKKTAYKRIEPGRAEVYWAKAQDFFRAMRDTTAAKNWNGAGLAGVHCAISASDALLVAKAGLRSSSKTHEDVVDLIRHHVRHPQTDEQTKRLGAILAEKNLIEYVDKSYTEKEALTLQKQVERYFGWVQALLNFQ